MCNVTLSQNHASTESVRTHVELMVKGLYYHVSTVCICAVLY